jgi:hypothetical protein
MTDLEDCRPLEFDYDYCPICGEMMELGSEPYEGLVCVNIDCEVNDG